MQVYAETGNVEVNCGREGASTDGQLEFIVSLSGYLVDFP
jgi:hypothetical protein